jgi:hypothetical protein
MMFEKPTRKSPNLPRELRLRLRRAADFKDLHEDVLIYRAIDEYLTPIEDDLVALGYITPDQRLLTEWPGV